MLSRSTPNSKNKFDDINGLKEKVKAGCEFLTTQMFFDNNIFFNFMYRVREAGIHIPIIPGIMPITKRAQVKNALNYQAAMCRKDLRILL